MKITKRQIGLYIGNALTVFVLAFALMTLGTSARDWVHAQDKPFDHSNCQYPDRWSNPVDGCDNSDPAVPECIKGMDTEAAEKACIAAFTAKNTPSAAEPVATTPANSEQKTYSCGDK